MPTSQPPLAPGGTAKTDALIEDRPIEGSALAGELDVSQVRRSLTEVRSGLKVAPASATATATATLKAI